jgi:type IV secretion system protein VirB3
MAELARIPVFRALTQPQMFAGVTYSFFIINAVIATEAFLITRSFWAIGIAAAAHMAGYLACLVEPRIFDLWITRARKCPRTSDWANWRCNSYGP